MYYMSKNSSDGIVSMIAIVILVILATPIYGIYLLTNGKTENQKALGIVLIVVGLIIWLATGIIGS